MAGEHARGFFMYRLVAFTTILLFALNGCVSDSQSDTKPHDQAPPAATKPAPRPSGIRPATIKAVWVDSWGRSFYSKRECDQLIAWCLQQGFNTLLVEVRRTGDAYYDSDLEPRGKVGEKGPPIADDFDPLQYLVEQAHDAHGLRVEAWIVANRIWVGSTPPPSSTPAHVANAHPTWLLVNREGTTHKGKKPSWYLDPSNPAVRRHLARICGDVASRYRVDAIHLDYIRYPDHTWGYGKESIASFRRDESTAQFPAPKDASFTAWRADQVTKQVREVRLALRRVAPKVELTVATVAWGDPPASEFNQSASYRSACQDWPRWCQEGLIDLNYVMHYRHEANPKQAKNFRTWIPILKRACGSADKLVLGLGSYLNHVTDSRRQMKHALAVNTAGIAVFSYRNPAKDGGNAVFGDILGRP